MSWIQILNNTGPRIELVVPLIVAFLMSCRRVNFCSLFSISCSLWSCNMFKSYNPVSNCRGCELAGMRCRDLCKFLKGEEDIFRSNSCTGGK